MITASQMRLSETHWPGEAPTGAMTTDGSAKSIGSYPS